METENSIDSYLDIIKAQTEGLNSKLDNLTEDLLNPSSTTIINSNDGISLLDLKNQIMISYIHNLINLLSIKLSSLSENDRIDDDVNHQTENQSRIVEELVWLRLVMEKLRPMEFRLKYQIDKLLKKVEEFENHQNRMLEDDHIGSFDQLDHIINDPLSFKPNLMAMENNDLEVKDEQIRVKDIDRTEDDRKKNSQNKIYKPPRVAPVAYPNTSKRNDNRRGPTPIALKEHITLSTSTPLMETTTGLSNMTAKNTSRAKALERMNEYEEKNMMRLFKSKKESRKRKDDEAAIALGIETSSHGLKRKLGGLESEFAGVLGEIQKKDDRYSKVLNNNHNHQKSRLKLDDLQSNDPFKKSSDKRQKKGSFVRAVSKNNKS